MHVGIGLIVFKEDGTIEIFNSAARKLLKINRAEKLNDLKEVSETLVHVFEKLKTGGRELVRLKDWRRTGTTFGLCDRIESSR